MKIDQVYQAASLLLDCACEGLAETEIGCPERRCVVPGFEPEVVNCCAGQGQLTVNLRRVFPSNSFPLPASGTPANCDAPITVATFGVEIWRCMPVGDMQFAPSCDELDDTAFITMTDAVAIRKGIVCCLRDKVRSNPILGNGYRFSLGDLITLGPQACVGSQLEVGIGFVNCWDC